MKIWVSKHSIKRFIGNRLNADVHIQNVKPGAEVEDNWIEYAPVKNKKEACLKKRERKK